MIDVRQLKTLRAVADHGTVSAAATALHLTPSAVSQQLAVLSRTTGCELLERRGRGVVLTDAARVLISHADVVFAQLERATNDLRALSASAPTTLRIGGFPTSVAGIIAPAMAMLRETLPGWEFEVSDTESEESLDRLLDGTMDVAVVMAAPNRPLLSDPRLKIEPLLEEEYYVALPADHALAGAADIALTDLVNESWILAREGFSCHDHISAICADAGFQPRGRHRSTDFPAALALVAAGCGITMIPRLGVPLHADPRIVLIPIRGGGPRRYCLTAMRQGAEYQAVVTAFRVAGIAAAGPVSSGS